MIGAIIFDHHYRIAEIVEVVHQRTQMVKLKDVNSGTSKPPNEVQGPGLWKVLIFQSHD